MTQSVSAVVVAHRSAATIGRCLRSLRGSETVDLDVDSVVWVNGDDPDTVAVAESLADRVVESPANLGFAAGCNRAASLTGGEWILLLNPDAFLQPGFWEEVEPVLAGTEVDLLVPGVVSPDGVPTSDPPEPRLLDLLVWSLAGGRASALFRRVTRPARTYVSGAALLVRRTAWERLGGFDERYFLFAEDADLSHRARTAGFRTTRVASAQVVHEGSQGTASKSPFALRCLVAGLVSYVADHQGVTAARVLHAAARSGAWARVLIGRCTRDGAESWKWSVVARASFGADLWFRWIRRADHPTVVVWPGRDDRSINHYARRFAGALSTTGCRVESFHGPRTFLTRPDVFHAHWPDALWSTPWFPAAFAKSVVLLAGTSLLRARGTSVVWTVHNLVPHDRPDHPVSLWFMHQWARRVDGLLVHSQWSDREVRRRYPVLSRVPAACVPHPDLLERADRVPDRFLARRRLHWPPDRDVVSFVGSLRRYKHVEQLLDAYCELADDSVDLRVVGAPSDERYAAELGDRFRLAGVPGFEGRVIGDDEFADRVAAATITVLPVERITNSGSAVTTLALGGRVLAPRRAPIEELLDWDPEAPISFYDPPLGSADLAAALDDARSHPETHPVVWPSWDQLAAATAHLYAQLTGAPAGHSGALAADLAQGSAR